MYKVILQRQPESYYRRAGRDAAARLEKCFESLEENPFIKTNKALKGEFKELYRARVGNLRVVYSVNKAEMTVHVLAILPRGDVYR
ncbi:MAG: type II toxin-antitoxin system RelE/ParE family toxin [Candidatus Schekmanbacteria bacterium]|nr:type II toxin-antitoxin system RelE/ParE family toxin [Candidatus Schekmanbacteria bacterium]